MSLSYLDGNSETSSDPIIRLLVTRSLSWTKPNRHGPRRDRTPERFVSFLLDLTPVELLTAH
jgi:hypothetical protein